MTIYYEIWINKKEIIIGPIARVTQTKEEITFFDENDEVIAFFKREHLKGMLRIKTHENAPMTETKPEKSHLFPRRPTPLSEWIKAESSGPFAGIPLILLNRSNENPPIEVEFAKESEPSEPKPYLGYMLEPLQPKNETPMTEMKSKKEPVSQENHDPFGRFLGSPFA